MTRRSYRSSKNSKGVILLLSLDPYDELIRLALDLYKKEDDFDTMYDKLASALDERPKLRYAIGVENFNKNREREPWVRGKNGEPQFEGGSIEEVARRNNLDIEDIEGKIIDFLNKKLQFKDLSEYWQKSFVEEVIEQVAYNVLGAYDDDT